MATLALSLAGQFAGALVGGPFGATVGRALGALAGSAIDSVLFGEKAKPGAANDIRLQGSSEGGAVPRLYGWSRVSGNIIWARELELLGGENAGAKGMPQPEQEEIGASFAIGLCEGEVHRLGRIWADGQLLDTEGLTLRFYRGTEDQLPDGLIEATQGIAPAYRGLCYLVVEQLPLSRFGNRIPQLSVELCRVVGELEPNIRAVTVIPGATEFGYDPVPRLQLLGPGTTRSENAHLAPTISNWTWSIDELLAICPNLERVALVVSWFGDDLRCGQCVVGPRVEAADRQVEGTEWRVAGLGRSEVPVVSMHGGGPAYGGTPSDAAVLAAIADLKARGIAVTLYPLIMMDIPEGNALPDPYGGEGGQAAYPWRGRITCDPAPGHPGSPDATAAIDLDVLTFAEAGFRDMVLHYAGLAAEAGGVDAFLIGSEMVGLTTLRGAGDSFPFVGVLVGLAAEVRALVGPDTLISYAADWSEYSGCQPDGQKFFHLDPLWASSDIDAVGIDNYMPLADWRDGLDHADRAMAESGYELDYLGGNVAGGEGYDWYYADLENRRAGVRSPITDGAYNEPWVYRYKDIRNWWSHAHHNRPGGVRQSMPTAWVPGSKPIWFTELGCGAVDKGANQPNIFGDSKSAESGRPYFSSGLPDALIQRQFLRAHHRFWADPANNPEGMVDPSRIYHWTWDARPFPAFPARTDLWSDGPNHRTGHWLTGRLGGMASDEMAVVVAAEHGVTLAADAALPFVHGYLIEQVSSGRDALAPLIEATGMSLRDGAEGLALRHPRRSGAVDLEADLLVRDEGPVLSRRRPNPAEVAGRLALNFLDRERDYLTGTVTALRDTGPLDGASLPLVLDLGGGRTAAEQGLIARGPGRETVDIVLPPSGVRFEPGDVINLSGLVEGPFEITEIRDGTHRRTTARSLPSPNGVTASADQRPVSSGSVVERALPVVAMAHLPAAAGDTGGSRLAIGAFARPWPGQVSIVDEATGALVARPLRSAVMGETTTPLAAGPVGVWDSGSVLELKLYGGHLASAEESAVLAGANRIAVQTDAGGWEIVGFAGAELVAPSTYRLTNLLRGQDGTVAAMGPVGTGRRVMLLDGRIASVAVPAPWLGETVPLRVYAGSPDITGAAAAAMLDLGPVLPLAPTHLEALRDAVSGAVAINWVRCSRADANGWGGADAPLDDVPERYRVEIRSGATLVRSVDCPNPSLLYGAADQVADFGSLPASFNIVVRQVSPVWGPGHPATGEFHG